MSFGSPTVTITVSLADLTKAQGRSYDQLSALLAERGIRRTPKTIGAVLRGEQSGAPKLVAALADILTSSADLRAACGQEPIITDQLAA